MTMLSDRIGNRRHLLVEAKLAHRDAEDDRGDYETAFKAGVNYSGLGSNKEAREIAMADLLRQDEKYQNLLQYERSTQARMEQAEVELECLLDERRGQEAETYAKMADYLAGRVDHVGYAPTQATRHVAKTDTAIATLEKLETERRRAQAVITNDGRDDEEPEDEYEIPF